MPEFEDFVDGSGTLLDGSLHWNPLLDHGLTKAADYILYLSGSQYRAVNGTTGKLTYSGSSYATVRNSATGSLTGIILDKVSNTFEGYSAGVKQTSINLTGSSLEFKETPGELSSGSWYGAYQPSKFVVHSGSGYYYAKDTETGKIFITGSVGGTFLQSVVNSIGTDAGRISIIDDIKLGSTTITLPETADTGKIFELDCVGDATLIYTGSTRAIMAERFFYGILKINIDCQSSGSKGLTLKRSRYCKVYPDIRNFTEIGLEVISNPGDQSLWNDIYNPYIYSIGSSSIGLEISTNSSNFNKVFGGKLNAKNICLNLTSGHSCSFYGVDISPQAGGTGSYYDAGDCGFFGCFNETGSGVNSIVFGANASDLIWIGGYLDVGGISNPNNVRYTYLLQDLVFNNLMNLILGGSSGSYIEYNVPGFGTPRIKAYGSHILITSGDGSTQKYVFDYTSANLSVTGSIFGETITGSTIISGSEVAASTLTVPYQSSSGSLASNLYLKIKITGSTYVLPVYNAS